MALCLNERVRAHCRAFSVDVLAWLGDRPSASRNGIGASMGGMVVVRLLFGSGGEAELLCKSMVSFFFGSWKVVDSGRGVWIVCAYRIVLLALLVYAFESRRGGLCLKLLGVLFQWQFLLLSRRFFLSHGIECRVEMRCLRLMSRRAMMSVLLWLFPVRGDQ